MKITTKPWIASIFLIGTSALVRRQGDFHKEFNLTKMHDSTAQKQQGTNRPLSGARLAAFCYLKQKLMHKYRLHPMPSLLAGGSKACALVSSSGALLKNTHGVNIDSHEIVFRFNKAPTANFERHVGVKTSFRLGWDFPAGFPVQNRIIYKGRTANATAALRHIYPHAKKQGTTTDPTSGFHGMLTGLSNCGSLDGYEIAPSRAAAESPYSYYSNWQSQNGGATYNSWHGYFKSEKELWLFLSTTPEAEIAVTGKSSYTCFDDVVCPNEAALFAEMPSEMRVFLENLVRTLEGVTSQTPAL